MVITNIACQPGYIWGIENTQIMENNSNIVILRNLLDEDARKLTP